jgi:putative tryptophan/tyrosine transport system substrate-binding protein
MDAPKRGLLFAAAALGLCPATLWAQTKKRFRIGFLATSDEATARPIVEVFVNGLHEKGYQPGKNLDIDFRYADGDIARLPALAGELVALKPDVLVGLQPAAVALRAKTATIPIVLAASNDPVGAGLVKSLARPGTNVTGLANRFDQALEKHIELLSEIVPGLSRIALLNYGPTSADSARAFQVAAEAAGRTRKIAIVDAVVRDEVALNEAFALFAARKAEAVIVVPTAPALQFRRAIIEHAIRHRLPFVSGLPPAWSEAGGLLNYGANSLAEYRYVASIVDRILKGANPADMPIEQPGRFELVVNLKTARDLGIKLPQSIMARADRVIE